MGFSSRLLTASMITPYFGAAVSFPRVGYVFPGFRRIGRWSFSDAMTALFLEEFTAAMAVEGLLPPIPSCVV